MNNLLAAKLAVMPMLALSLAMPARAVEDKSALASSKGCVACHDVNTKKVGPAFKDVAAKYAGQKDAASKLTAKVLNGGAGVWGQVAMPPNKAMGVSESDARQLVEWVLSLNGAPDKSTGNKTPVAPKKK
jgi:cytochrome c